MRPTWSTSPCSRISCSSRNTSGADRTCSSGHPIRDGTSAETLRPPPSGQLEAVEIPASAPVLQHPDERRRAGAVEAVARAPRGRLALVVVVARGTALEELQVHPRQVDDGLHPGVFRLLAGLDARRTAVA